MILCVWFCVAVNNDLSFYLRLLMSLYYLAKNKKLSMSHKGCRICESESRAFTMFYVVGAPSCFLSNCKARLVESREARDNLCQFVKIALAFFRSYLNIYNSYVQLRE